jgi:hypothetical protein
MAEALRIAARPGRRAAAFELLQARYHQAIRLAGERRRKNRMPFRIAGQLLRERDQVLAARWLSPSLFFHEPSIVLRVPARWQPQRFVATAPVAYALTVPPAGPRSIKQFDPGRLASLELRTWQRTTPPIVFAASA